MSTTVVVISDAIVAVSAFAIGYNTASLRHAQFMLNGWRYLRNVSMARGRIEVDDIFAAFSVDAEHKDIR